MQRIQRIQRIKIGWREWLVFPELGIRRVKAKVDTGARTSSLHAFDVEILRRGARSRVRFKVHPLQRDGVTTVRCEAPLHDERWIRSSNGERELRPVIRAEVQIGGQTWPIELTLTSRDSMGFRMLLGREAIRRRCVVDPGQSYLVSRHLKPKKKVVKKKRAKKKSGDRSVARGKPRKVVRVKKVVKVKKIVGKSQKRKDSR